MTEAEWLASADAGSLLARLDRPRGDRELLLAAVACCRLHWYLLASPASRAGVEWAERYADGLEVQDEAYSRLEWASEGAAFAAESAAESAVRQSRWNEEDARPWLMELALRTDAAYFANAVMNHDDSALSRYGHFLDCDLIRDIFGNPFRPVTIAPNWRTSNAVGVAEAMYAARDFSAAPILADALEDAGCDVMELLAHLRGPGEHVRGCWAVDLVLGKT